MIYTLLRFLAKISFLNFYKKIYFTNSHKIPREKPLMIASSHPTAFLEPAIYGVLLPKNLSYLVRGDMFKKERIRRALGALHMVPIFRKRDSAGINQKKRNQETFEYCYNALNENKMINIFSEGVCVTEKRLRPLMKGTARIALGALEKYPKMDLMIVPVGASYSIHNKFRTELMIQFGDPIRVQDYFSEYILNKNKSISKLTNDLFNRIKERLVNIDYKEDEDIVEQALIIGRSLFNEKQLPIISDNAARPLMEINITNVINKLQISKKEDLRIKLNSYFKKINEYRIDDIEVFRDTERSTLKDYLVLFFGFIPSIIGYIGNFLPMIIGKTIVRKSNPKSEFYLSVLWAVGYGVFIAYYLILLILSISFKSIPIILGALFFFILWRYHWIYLDYYNRVKLNKNYKGISDDEKDKLKVMRKEISKILEI